MRMLMAFGSMLILFGSTWISAEDQKEADQGRPKRAIKQTGTDKENERVFRLKCELEVEQKSDSDLVIEGKTIPGRHIVRTSGTWDLLDNQRIVWPLGRAEYSEANGHRHSEESKFEFKIKSVNENLVRLEVTSKQSTTELVQAGGSRSWNLTFEGSKTAKLGEKVKLEFGDEKTLRTKCTFEGVIEEKASHKK